MRLTCTIVTGKGLKDYTEIELQPNEDTYSNVEEREGKHLAWKYLPEGVQEELSSIHEQVVQQIKRVVTILDQTTNGMTEDELDMMAP